MPGIVKNRQKTRMAVFLQVEAEQKEMREEAG